MKQALKTSKDTLLMSALVVTGLVMTTLGAATAEEDSQAVMQSAGRMVQSVSTPTAMQAIQHREAAIIASAPRLRSHA